MTWGRILAIIPLDSWELLRLSLLLLTDLVSRLISILQVTLPDKVGHLFPWHHPKKQAFDRITSTIQTDSKT